MIKKLGPKALLTYIIFVCLLIPLLLVPQTQFPFLGISIVAVILAFTIYAFKANKLRFDSFLVFSLSIISVFFVVRANPVVEFINIITLVVLLALLAINNSGPSFSGFINVLASPIYVFLNTLVSENKISRIIRGTRAGSSFTKSKEVLEYAGALAITLLVLFIIIPLLSSANPIFSDLVVNFTKMFKFDLNILFIARLILFTIALYFVPKLISHVENETDKFSSDFRQPAIKGMFIPKLIVSLILTVFLITHFELYFGSPELLQTFGYSYSKLTNEVFAQLIIVCFIVYLLIYNDNSADKKSKILTGILISQAILLNLFALKSDIDYINQWGFTTKRLFGLVGVTLVFGVFLIYVLKSKYGWNTSSYIKYNIVFLTIIIVTINLLNFDRIIYKNSSSTHATKVDHLYLSTLSTDTMHLYEHFNYLRFEFKTGNRDPLIVGAYANEVQKIEKLQSKYKDFSAWQSFNLSEYLAYTTIKDVNATVFLRQIDRYYQDTLTNDMLKRPALQSSPQNIQVR